MKTIFAIFALLAVTCYAAPALEKSKTLKYEYDVPLTKGEAHMQNEPEGKFWIPFWDYVTGWFSKKQELPTSNNEMKMAKPVEPTYLPNLNKDDFEDSHEFLEEMSNQLFPVEEETQELKEVHSDEVRYMNYKTPEHVRDAVIHGKVNMPKRDDFADYESYLEQTSHHLFGRAEKAKPKPEPKKFFWDSLWG